MAKTIGFDISALDPDFKEHAKRGIGRYVGELKSFFDRQAAQDIEVGYFDHRSLVGQSKLDSFIAKLPYGRATVKQQILYPLRLWKGKTAPFNFLHFPAHMDAPSWSVKNFAITVLDLIPLVLKDLYKANRPGWRYGLARFLEIRAIKRAKLIMAISQNTANDVARLLKIPAERIRVTPLGVDAKFFEAPAQFDAQEFCRLYKLPLKRPIIVYVGGIDPRKNIKDLLEALKILLEERREKGQDLPCLVIAGRIEKDDQFPRLLEWRSSLGLEEHVILPGYVPDQDLLKLFKLSSAFLFLSLYEGFGLPPLEAMAAGVPVVSSNTSCLPEVLGDAASLVAPHDVAKAATELNAILNNSVYAKMLSTRGREQARKFTWERTGQLTLDAYRELCGL